MDIHQQVGNIPAQGIGLANIAVMYYETKQYNESQDYNERAIEIAKQIGNPIMEGIVLGNLGETQEKLGEELLAQESFERSIACLTKAPHLAAPSKSNLALLKAKQGDPKEALSLMSDAERSVRENPLERGKVLCKKGMMHLLLNQLSESQSALENAHTIATDLQVTTNSDFYTLIQELEKAIQQQTNGIL